MVTKFASMVNTNTFRAGGSESANRAIRRRQASVDYLLQSLSVIAVIAFLRTYISSDAPNQ